MLRFWATENALQKPHTASTKKVRSKTCKMNKSIVLIDPF